MKCRWLLLAVFPFLFSCSKFLDKFSRSDDATTKVSFTTQNAALLAATLPGGILVYAERDSDFFKASVKLDNEDDITTQTLPNGVYDFIAVGWPTSGLTGNPKCGFHVLPSGPVALTGAPVTVTIDLNSTDCDDDFFAPAPLYRTGSNFNYFEFKFCNSHVDISGYSSAQLCDQTRESTRFVKGRTSSGVGASGEGFIDTTSLRMVYQSDPHVSNRKEVFSVDLDGVGTVKESGTSTVGGFNVTGMHGVPGEGKIIFSANKDNASYELYISDLGYANPTKISGTMTSPGTAYGVKAFRVNSTGTHVVFVGDMDTTGIYEVYSVNLNTGTRTKLNPAVTAGTGVRDSGGWWLMDISPDGNSVVWVATTTVATTKAIFSASISGAAGSGVKLSGTAPQVNFEVMNMGITHDSAKVVWSGDYNTDNINDIYVANMNDDDSSQIINEATGTSGVTGQFYLAKDALKLVYAADRNGFNSQSSIYSADLSVASPFNRTRIHTITTTSSNLYNLKFNDDETKVAYFSDGATIGTYKIYSATIGTADSQVDRSHTSADSMPFETGGGGGGEGPIQITTDNRVFYKGSVTPNAAEVGVYEFSLANGALATLQSQAHATNREVNSFSLGYSKLFFPFDSVTDGLHQLFYFTPGVSVISELSIIGGNLGSVKGVHIPKGSEVLSGYPNAMAVAGYATSSNLEDVFFLPDYTNPSDLRQLTHTYHQASGIGKIQIHMLEYTTDPGGNITWYNTAISSACLDGPTTDGSAKLISTDAVQFPTGDGLDDSPFATAIDIFPEAEDCSGSPQRILFPNGIASPSTSNAPGKLRLTGAGSTPVLFIKD